MEHLRDISNYEFSDFDAYLFAQGSHNEIYKKLGAHPCVKDGEEGVLFAVWAPNASYVSVTGDFNGWNRQENPCVRHGDDGVWSCFVPGNLLGNCYKFCIRTSYGAEMLKSDPYGVTTELRPGNSTKVGDVEGFVWRDGLWMGRRKKTNLTSSAMSIYEVHPGSWMKHPWSYENPQGFYSFRELAEPLANYVKDMGYTHIELIGVAEHPFDGSWGYQVSNYYAPTSRHGSPKDFMYFINYMHQKGIGVILDWVPAHFPKDAHGLAEFDGTCLYEYSDPRKGEQPQWGTKVFDFGRNEVRNFLLANVLYWLKEYHVDGIRVDAVSSMLYLDFCRPSGQWVPNVYGGRENLEAISLLKKLNEEVKNLNTGAIVIAEESTAWPNITGNGENSLGFDFKWNMGWMNDFLEYMKLDPIYRKYHHNKMNFSMMYAYSENFILVLSHDEVVHLKKSMLNKMPGDKWNRMANLRAAYTFMMGHPGKKLLFMGQEFAQEQEWSEQRELDWGLLGNQNPDQKLHVGMQNYVRELLHLYRANRCMYQLDQNEAGFHWISADDANRSIFSFERHSADGKNNLIFICNFTPVEWSGYRVGVPKKKNVYLMLDSNEPQFGGYGEKREERMIFKPEEVEADHRPYSFEYSLPAYGALVFRY